MRDKEPFSQVRSHIMSDEETDTLQPAQLFQESDEEYVSNEELDTLIPAATMRLNCELRTVRYSLSLGCITDVVTCNLVIFVIYSLFVIDFIYFILT